jgi:CHASE3 domain sensor protein/two-component sensor histidine kinase
VNTTKKLTLKSKIDIAFCIVAVIFIVLIYSTYSRAQLVKENREIIYHTSSVNNILEKVLSSSIDIETGTRGYAITGKENYLEAFNSGSKKIDIWLDSLRSMNNTNQEQLQKLDSIEHLINSKKRISQLTIDTRKNLGLVEASKLVEIGRGKEVMDSIRKIVADFQQTQINLLSQKLIETDEHVKQRNFVFLLFVVMTIGVIFFAYRMIRKTAEKTVQKEVIQADLITELSIQNNQMNDFASITSHNLRSPAANITSLISMVDEDSRLEDYKKIFEMLKKVSINLNETLNHLLEILSIKKNKTMEKETIILDEIFIKTTETLQGEILICEAEIESDFNNAPQIEFPRIYIESIFHNLISNALKYRSPDRKPKITVRTEMKDNQILLSVKDNGLGIDLVKHGAKMFGMHKVFHKHPDANGIGLFMTKAQIESLGGKISVKSEVGSGTTFTVVFN